MQADAALEARARGSARSLPSGLVTFVLTDIEGSTRLFRHLGEQYVELLETHRTLLRVPMVRHGGVELGTEGDSLLIAFPDAAAALAACLDGQRALLGYDWPAGAVLRVRIGVHTGEATPIGDDYVSLALHQVARVSSSAHGGQILVSEATAREVERRLPQGATLAPLGSFQLRGFAHPERLFQLRHPDLTADFPPPRAVGIVAHNLPVHRSGFVGRRAERSGLADALTTTGVVSVVGLGGVGKTRLALQVAFDVLDRFADGAWLIELAALTDRISIVRELAGVMSVAHEPGRSRDELLVEHLMHKSALLLFDNCEHVLDTVAELIELLSHRCPHLVFLATSREPLDIEGEVVWRIGPLPTLDPESVHGARDAAQNDAVQLFVSRASLVSPEFALTDENAADVAGIVRQLNGIPLAIELAAAALEDRSLRGVVAGLADRFSLLTRGRRTAPSRHQTLRAALEWSLDLLRPEERRLFADLAVFAGAGSVTSLHGICCDGESSVEDVRQRLRRLGRASLLLIDPDDHDRWTMLESMRELAALELAASGRDAELHRRFRHWFRDYVEQASEHVGRRDSMPIVAGLDSELDNIRRAVDGAIASEDRTTALRIAVAMAPYWMSHGEWSYGIQLLRGALAGDGGAPSLRGEARTALGNLLLLKGDLDEAERLFAELGTDETIAADDLAAARFLSGRGFVAFRRSLLDDAERDWEAALQHAERSGDDRVLASILRNLAIAAGSRGEQDRTRSLLLRAQAAAEQAGDDQQLRLILGSIAEMELWLGDYTAAEIALGDALDLADSIGDLAGRPIILGELGWIALLRGDLPTAMRLSIAAAELAEDLGNRRTLSHSLRLRGESMMRMGQMDDAAHVLEEALEAAMQLGAPAEIAGVRCSQACLALEQTDVDHATELAEAAIGSRLLRHAMRKSSPEWVLGAAALIAGEVSVADEQFRRSLDDAVYARLPRHEAAGQWGRGHVDLIRGDITGAARRHLRAIELWTQIDDRLGLAESLVSMAELGAAADTALASGLLVAAAELRTAAQAVLTPREEVDLGRAMDALTVAGGDIGSATGKVSTTEILQDVRSLASQLDPESVPSEATRR